MSDFALDPAIIYLNHAAVAPWPQCTVEAVAEFARQNGIYGSQNYLQWLAKEEALRSLLAQLINAPSKDDIALLKSTSEGLSFVAYGLDWQTGDNIVSIAQEFPSNRIVWESLLSRGVELRLLDLDVSNQPEQELLSLCDERTRLISVSSIQYANGRKTNLNILGDYCRSKDILFVVDAIQSLGASPFDVAQCKADIVVADGHKWMLGPEGLALFYCRESIREQLKLNEYGWHMVEAMGDFDQKEWQLAKSARRFECGSPNMLGVHALHTSLTLLLEQGLESVSSKIQGLTQIIIDQVDASGFQLVTPRTQEMRGGIITFHVPDHDNQLLYQRLMEQRVMCAYRGGGVRFSPHFHNTEEQILEAFTRLKSIL
ncbi:MAG: aminotransferase class V-fold PLP-dependent enzyme [Candidatus Thiodiazotropha sp. DIVDIV]